MLSDTVFTEQAASSRQVSNTSTRVDLDKYTEIEKNPT